MLKSGNLRGEGLQDYETTDHGAADRGKESVNCGRGWPQKGNWENRKQNLETTGGTTGKRLKT
jgi:hypothetical protein